MPKGTIGQISISPSTLKVADCPFALYCKVAGVPPDGRNPELSQYGKAQHSIFDQINRWHGVIDDLVIDKIVASSGAQDIRWMRQSALDYVKYFPLDRVLASEQKLGLDINLRPCPFEDAVWRGIVDAVLYDDYENWMGSVMRTIDVTDHKAGWKLQNPECMQTEFYLWVLARTYPMAFDAARLSMHFPRYKIFRHGKYLYKQHDIDRIERAMITATRKVWETPLNGPAIPGAQCANCNWISRCPVPDVEMTEIHSELQAQELAGQIRVLDIRMREMKRKLRNFISRNNNEPVILKDHRYQFGPMDQATYEADPMEIIEKMDEWATLRSHLKVDSPADLIGHPSGINVEQGIKQVYKGQGYEPPDEEANFEEIKA